MQMQQLRLGWIVRLVELGLFMATWPSGQVTYAGDVWPFLAVKVIKDVAKKQHVKNYNAVFSI